MYVEWPICMDVMCSSDHVAYDARKKHRLATNPSYRTIVQSVFENATVGSEFFGLLEIQCSSWAILALCSQATMCLTG